MPFVAAVAFVMY